MFTIRNALLYVKNHREVSTEQVKKHLEDTLGISKVSPATKANYLIFIDYQPETVSLNEIFNGLSFHGVQPRLIGM